MHDPRHLAGNRGRCDNYRPTPPRSSGLRGAAAAAAAAFRRAATIKKRAARRRRTDFLLRWVQCGRALFRSRARRYLLPRGAKLKSARSSS